MHSKIKPLTKLTAAVMLLSAAAGAHAQIYKVVLSGSNEIPAVASNGSGTAIISLNTTTHEMRVSANFTGLTGNTTASHVHCCVVLPANAGVATTTPTFPGLPLGVTAGAWDSIYNMSLATAWNPAFVTANGGTPAGAEAAFVAGVAAGRSYLNIHSSTSPGGEIRGTLLLNSFAAAASPRSAGLAAALDSLGAGTGAVSDRLVAMALLNSTAQKSAIDMLLPTSSTAVETVIADTLFTDFDQMGSRLQGLRMNAPAATQANGLWSKGFSSSGKHDTTSGAAGYENDGWDFAIGYDRQIAPGLVAGAAVSIADHSIGFIDQFAGSSTDISTTQASVYGSKVLGSGYVEAMLSYGTNDSAFLRNAGLAGSARAKADSNQWGARIAGGVIVDLGSALTVTPQARLDWMSLDQDGYQETGAGGLALNVGSQSLDRVRTSVGAQFDWNTGTIATPFVRAFWNHDNKDAGSTQLVSFVAGGTSFMDAGQGIDKNSYSLGFGINFRSKTGLSAAIGYDRVSSSNFESDIFQGKLFWAF